jgi:Ca2+-binding EF-hand superfamily protein
VLVCEILRIPAPLEPDRESTMARNEILKQVGFILQPHPEYLDGDLVVRYGPFLKAFRRGLEKSPLVASNPMVNSETERVVTSKSKLISKGCDLTVPGILKIIDLNLPKYYRSTTEAFLRMKPPGGVFRIDDFARFMRSINVDLPDEKLQELFNVYDKNGNGGLDAWEFIERFGPAINGHTSTSLFMAGKSNKREPTKLKQVQLNAEQVKELVMARLPFHFKSSTKAFLSAKGGVNPRSHTISFADLRLFLNNLNIVVPDETVHDLFKFLDIGGKGSITCADFIKAFGHAISGENCDNISDANHVIFQLRLSFEFVLFIEPSFFSCKRCRFTMPVLTSDYQRFL